MTIPIMGPNTYKRMFHLFRNVVRNVLRINQYISFIERPPFSGTGIVEQTRTFRRYRHLIVLSVRHVSIRLHGSMSRVYCFAIQAETVRSEERRVGKECRYRWWR